MKDEMISLLKKWAEINSYSHNPEGLKKMREELIKTFSPLADEHEVLGNEVLSFKKTFKDKQKILLIGHYDTVYPENFPVEVKNGYLHGPGVADMKGGLVLILNAIKNLNDQFSWEVLLNHDEEIGSKSSMPLMMKRAVGSDLIFIFEPAMPNGSLVNTRPSSGVYKVVVTGVEAHAGRNPEAGKNAIFALADLLYQFSLIHQPEKGILLNVGTIEGGVAPNVIPAKASARFNVRAKTDQDHADIMELIADLIQYVSKRHGTGIKLEKLSYRPTKLLSPRTRNLMNHFASTYGVSFEPSRGVCDSNDLSHTGIPVIDSLGPIGHDLHTKDERLQISSLEERLQSFLKALKTLPASFQGSL